MIEAIIPVLVCLLFWWLGTGIVLRLDSLPERTYRGSMIAFTVVAVAVIVGLYLLRNTATVGSAYLSFCGAMILWGWLEFMHYSGYLVGPGLSSCPPGVSTIRRFTSALHAMLYHEVALVFAGLGMTIMLWSSPNKTALYAYLVLWIMRISAELNVFFGVANLPEEWLPKKLQYLMSYRQTKRVNAFFPLSVGMATIVCIWWFAQMPSKTVDPFGYATCVLTGTLLALAIIEHWLLVMPVKSTALWSWAQSRSAS